MIRWALHLQNLKYQTSTNQEFKKIGFKMTLKNINAFELLSICYFKRMRFKMALKNINAGDGLNFVEQRIP